MLLAVVLVLVGIGAVLLAIIIAIFLACVGAGVGTTDMTVAVLAGVAGEREDDSVRAGGGVCGRRADEVGDGRSRENRGQLRGARGDGGGAQEVELFWSGVLLWDGDEGALGGGLRGRTEEASDTGL